jgi:N-acyl homoserine lactone hydrolase
MSYFPEAVHVVQRDEIRYALWPDPWTRPVYCQNDYRDRKLNILELDGDFDLFNDGILKLVKTPGHAPGHQVLIVDLPNRGRVWRRIPVISATASTTWYRCRGIAARAP